MAHLYGSFPLDDFRKNKNKNLSYFLLFHVHADLYLPFLDICRGYHLRELVNNSIMRNLIIRLTFRLGN